MSAARRLSAASVLVALALLAGSLGFQKIRDFDYWWHARTGALIAETGSVPHSDVFTYTVEGSRWVDIHWLFQLGLHGVRRLGGHDAVIVAKTLLVLAIAGVLLPIGWRRDRPFVSGLAIGLALLVAGDRFMARPELPSFVLLAAILLLVDRHERRGDRWILAAVPVQLLWANIHGLFAVGLAVLAIALVAEGLRPVMQPGTALRRRAAGYLAAALALSVLATLLNPNGVSGLLYPLQQLDMVGPADQRGLFGALIAELAPPLGGDRALGGFAGTLVVIEAGLAFGALALNWRRAGALDALLLVAFGYLALGAYRNLALFALVAAPVTVRNLNAWLDTHRLPARVLTGSSVAAALLLLAATADVADDRFFQRWGSPREFGWGVMDVLHPVGAADWIEREHPPGPIAHHMADGGYLLYRLWPDYRVMIDGRLEVFGPDTFAALQFADVERFRALDEQYRFGAVLVHYTLADSRELLWWLHLNPNWRLVEVDDAAALFVHERSGDHRWPELDLDAPDLFPPLGGARSPSDRLRREARVTFFVDMHRWARALALWEETLERYPDEPNRRLLRAYLLAQDGFPAAAEALLHQQLAERPDDPDAAAQLADLRWQDGDLDGARVWLARARASDPNHPHALQRRAQLAEALGDVEGARFYWDRLRAMSPSADWVLRASRVGRESAGASASQGAQ